jgi:hypothetical protein
MPGSATQQVTAYPFEPLSSIYANELLYGVVSVGINAPSSGPGVVITNGNLGLDNTSVCFTIKSGTVFYFQRAAADPQNNAITDIMLGKITTTSDDTSLTVSKASLWNTVTSFATTQTLYIVANWQYIPGDSTDIHLTFSLVTDSGIASIKAQDGTSTHSVVVATILGQSYYTNAWVVNNWTSNLSQAYSASLSNYHIAYDYQAGRNILNRSTRNNDAFVVDFDPNGNGVYVESGNIIVADGFLPWTPTFAGGLPYPNRVSTTGILPPSTGLQYYISNVITNAKIDVIASSTQSSYYQIDFLRFKSDENTHVINMYWESFLQPQGGLDFTNYTMTTAQLLGYLSQYQFPIVGDGLPLLIAVRPRASIPTSQGASNQLWPESCIFPKHNIIPVIGTVKTHSRFKLPVWSASDLGY